jgi:hypothetical protein
MKKKLERPILAEGETTGHYHALSGNVDVFEENDVREFRLDEPNTLTHQEHKKIEIPEGDYQSGIAIEYDHFLEESRKVVD